MADEVPEVVVQLPLPDEEVVIPLGTVGDELEVGIAYFSSMGEGGGGSGIPEATIRGWDAEVLDQAHTYADQVYIDLSNEIDNLTPTVQRIDQLSSNNEYHILELRGRVDNLVIPTVDVTKAYVDAADTALGQRITDITPASIGAALASHTHTKAQVGLGNVDNTTDLGKPVSTATQAALDLKSDTGHRHPTSDIIGLPTTPTWSTLSGKPTTFPPEAHSHAFDSITERPTAYPPSAHSHAWGDVTGKPTTFTPAAHTHTVSQITDMPATPTWATLGGKPTTFPPSAHQHAASDITSGVFAPARLGTGTASASTVLYGDGAWKDAPTGGGGSGGLTGPGRPDVPAGTGLANEIAAAPVGTLYNSTDGAGAGAWAWRKRPVGWVVVDGDTGVRRFVISNSAFPSNASYVEYRRRQDSVFLQVNSTNAGAWRLNALTVGSTVPVLVAQPGFRPSSGAMAELNNDGRGRLGAYLLQMPPNDGQGALQIRAFEAGAANQWVRVPILTWLTLDDWPATLPGIAV